MELREFISTLEAAQILDCASRHRKVDGPIRPAPDCHHDGRRSRVPPQRHRSICHAPQGAPRRDTTRGRVIDDGQ